MTFTAPFDIRIALYFCAALVAICILICVGMLVKEPVLERIRRKKHPRWFELYNRALANSLCVGSRFHEKTETLENRYKMVQELLFKGKCTAEEYQEAMKTIATEYSKAVEWFNLTKESLGIEADLKEADKYAKDHDLKWGILYED